MGILRKFLDGTLTQNDIREWLVEQGQVKILIEKEVLQDRDLNHIAVCMYHIFLAYHGRMPLPLGHFLTAIIENDFIRACGAADSTNALVLPLYASFLYNCVPADYPERLARPQKEG